MILYIAAQMLAGKHAKRKNIYSYFFYTSYI